tara:strand:- start:301 stop:483 length:183 start_codon:yes stop_codon:yes gene_type:complete
LVIFCGYQRFTHKLIVCFVDKDKKEPPTGRSVGVTRRRQEADQGKSAQGEVINKMFTKWQ